MKPIEAPQFQQLRILPTTGFFPYSLIGDSFLDLVKFVPIV